jgi:dGTPase
VEAACLAHDLGHPPFGHNGEAALDEVARSCGGFEGNAQSLRILVRLEAKILGDDDVSAGLNLTRAAVDAATKYPWPRREDTTKFGVYPDDRPAFDWARAGAPGERRCIEAQVMDWADDVAYSVHDLEDAVHAGHLLLDVLLDPAERADLLALTADLYAPGVTTAELEAALDRLLALPYWPSHFDESHRALAGLKETSSELIGRFCRAAEVATKEAFGDGGLTRYGADLVVPDLVRQECAVLKGVTARYVMQREGAPAHYERQRDVVQQLVAQLMAGAPGVLEPVYRAWFDDAVDDAGRLRVVVDQVASLTDPAALALHARLATA